MTNILLDAGPVHKTIVRLAQRTEERFPGSGLGKVAAELIDLSEENQQVVDELRRPLWSLRIVTIVAIAVVVLIVGWATVVAFRLTGGEVREMSDLLQAAEAAINELIFLFIAIFFLVSLETRFKRRRALVMLHRLRSIAHVVDMHQLTKDPEQALQALPATTSSPQRNLTRPQLARYLEYCSEMLALISKLAALHTQYLQDPVVLDAVNDVETLTSDLSRKVWQKITILDMAKP